MLEARPAPRLLFVLLAAIAAISTRLHAAPPDSTPCAHAPGSATTTAAAAPAALRHLAASGAAPWQQRLPDPLRSEILTPILNHTFSLPEPQLRKGLVYTGSNYRLRRVVRDLVTGHRVVRVGVIGGSISWGTGASTRGTSDWFSLFSGFMMAAFPRAQLVFRNGCVPATPSSYMIMCLELSVDREVDLLVMEYLLNDAALGFTMPNPTKSYERLVRRVLALPHNPAIVLLQVTRRGASFEPGSEGARRFHDTPEESYGAIAQYYDLPWLSFRTALWRLTNVKKTWRWADVMWHDLWHPGDLGHQVLADLMVWLLQQTALDLQARPFSQADEEMVMEQLPEPMHEGNEAPAGALCFHQDLMRPLVLDHAGWAFVNEGTEDKPKKGYVSSTPGSVLTLKVNTQRPGPGRPGADDRVPVMLALLHSYVGMGTARLACVAGCSCGEKEVDTQQGVRESQTHLTELRVSQHPECVLAVTVLERSNPASGRHKVKVSGIMIAERAPNQADYVFGLREGQWNQEFHTESQLVFGRGLPPGAAAAP